MRSLFTFLSLMAWTTLSIAQIGVQLSWQKPSGDFGADFIGGPGAEISWSFTPRSNQLNLSVALGYHVFSARNDTVSKFVFENGNFVPGWEYLGNLRTTSIGVQAEYRLSPHKVAPVVGVDLNYLLMSGDYAASSPEFGNPDWEDNQTAIGFTLRLAAAYLMGEHSRFDLGAGRASSRNSQLSEWQSFWEPYARFIYYF